jgi:ribonuclease HI
VKQPTDLLPITTYCVGGNIRIDSVGSPHSIHDKEVCYWSTTSDCVLKGQIDTLVDCMKKQQIIIMSDGSVKGNTAGASWIITTKNAYDMGCYIQGKSLIPDIMCDSHRAECYGILGGIITLNNYMHLWYITSNEKLQICCDNVSALNYAANLDRYRYISGNIPDYDVLSSIRVALYNIPLEYKHVKGHQDNDANAVLDFYAQLNIRADCLAKQGCQVSSNSNNIVVLDYEIWKLQMGDIKICKNINLEMHDKINKPLIQEYWHKKGKVQEDHICTHINNVSLDIIGKVMQGSSIQQHNSPRERSRNSRRTDRNSQYSIYVVLL